MITADTNVFVYASDETDPGKQDIARRIVFELAVRQAPIALQLVGELQNALRRKLKAEAWLAAETASHVLATYPCFPMSYKSVGLALAQMASGRLSYWDALMLASAREAGCHTFISEDLQDGATLFGLEIVNPFGVVGPSARVCELLDLS